MSTSENQIEVGDWVQPKGMSGVGRVLDLDAGKKRARIAIGGQEWVVKLSTLSLAQPPEAPRREPPAVQVTGGGAVQYEIDLHGMRAEDALMAVEGFIDQAVVNHLAVVRIVHGHGTGVLRTEVRKLLTNHPMVTSFRFGQPYEGGLACTIAELRQY